eukprot:1084727-Rhodomonas_salina.3
MRGMLTSLAVMGISIAHDVSFHSVCSGPGPCMGYVSPGVRSAIDRRRLAMGPGRSSSPAARNDSSSSKSVYTCVSPVRLSSYSTQSSAPATIFVRLGVIHAGTFPGNTAKSNPTHFLQLLRKSVFLASDLAVHR